MAKAITGRMDIAGWGKESPEYKGSVIIEWSGRPGPANQILPGVLQAVRDVKTGDLIPAASMTVHVPCPGLITADVAVYLDEHGEIIYDLARIAESDAVPATFPFLVAGMTVC